MILCSPYGTGYAESSFPTHVISKMRGWLRFQGGIALSGVAVVMGLGSLFAAVAILGLKSAGGRRFRRRHEGRCAPHFPLVSQ
jgi:hypothetical protein